MRIALAGTGPLGMSLLMPLVESRHEVVAVVQNGRKTTGLRRQVYPRVASVFQSGSNVAGAAKRLGLPLVWLTTMNEELAPLRALAPDLLLVGGFGIILKSSLLNLPTIGCVNCHASLLPRHRGPNPYSAVVLSGEDTSGVTFHIMEEGIDTGPIIDQMPFPLIETDTAYTVYEKSAHISGQRVVAVIDQIEAHGLKGTPQDESRATYDPKLRDDDLLIDWSATAREIHRKIRACCLSPFARTYYRGTLVHIARAQMDSTPVADAPGTVVAAAPLVKIATGDGTISVRVAFTRERVPMIWPVLWNRPVVGERLG